MNALKYAVLGLAAARLTRLVVDDEITAPVRGGIESRAVNIADDNPTIQPWSFLDDVVNCHACTSVWAGAGVLIAEQLGPVGRFLVRTLALSQSALLVKAVIDRIDR